MARIILDVMQMGCKTTILAVSMVALLISKGFYSAQIGPHITRLSFWFCVLSMGPCDVSWPQQ